MADNSKSLIQQAKALVEKGQFDQAVPLLDEALSQNPKRATGWFIRGVALTQQGQFAAAVESYSQALNLNPDLPKVWYFKARAEFDQSLFNDCIESCEQGLKHAGSNEQLAGQMRNLLKQARGKAEEGEELVSIAPVSQAAPVAAAAGLTELPPEDPTAGGDDEGGEGGGDVAQFQREEGGEESEMDMTPMVDVTFLLLIFFMVTAAFNLQKSLVVPAPQEESSSQNQEQPEEDPDTMTIHVLEDSTYRVEIGDEEQEPASEHELYRQVRRMVNAAAKQAAITKLVVIANEEAFHGKIVTALDAGMSVGMEQIQLKTVEEDE